MDISKIEKLATDFQASLSGKVGFGFKDLKSGQSFFLNPEDAFPTASTFKVYILAETFRQIEEGRFALSQRFELTEDIKSMGSGVFQNLDAGLMPTIKDYATLMMIISDNTATDFLFDLAGKENIKNNILKAYGFDKTKCDLPCRDLIGVYYGAKKIASMAEFEQYKQENAGRVYDLRLKPPFACEIEENDETSMYDIVRAFDLLYNGKLVSADASRQMLDIMRTCQTNTRIPKRLPDGVEVAHKTGTIDRVANDVGIVYTQKGDYILSIFYNGNLADEREYAENAGGLLAEPMLAKLSLDIYNAYVE